LPRPQRESNEVVPKSVRFKSSSLSNGNKSIRNGCKASHDNMKCIMSSESFEHNLHVELILSFLLNFPLSFCKVYVPQAIIHLIHAEVIIRNFESIERDIAIRQLATKPKTSDSWFIEIVKLLELYELPCIAS
jgi:hypothetical protein